LARAHYATYTRKPMVNSHSKSITGFVNISNLLNERRSVLLITLVVTLVIRPNDDPATQITSKWAEEVVDYAQGRGLQVVDLHGSLANPVRFRETLEKMKPCLIVHYGHGTEDALLGQDQVPLLTLDNVGLIRGITVYTIGCHIGKRLGKAMVEAGGYVASAYAGQYVFDPFNETPFRESVNAGAKALIEGKTLGEAYQAVRQTYDGWILLEFNRELDFIEQSIRELNSTYRTNSGEGNGPWTNLTEAYELRKSSLKMEIAGIRNKTRPIEADKVILEAFHKIQIAEHLSSDGLHAGSTSGPKQLAVKLLDYAKRYWVRTCRKCGYVNPISRYHCSECGMFLLTQSVACLFI